MVMQLQLSKRIPRVTLLSAVLVVLCWCFHLQALSQNNSCCSDEKSEENVPKKLGERPKNPSPDSDIPMPFQIRSKLEPENGIAEYLDGRVYEGEWLNGMKHGEGKEKYPDGSEYEGEFRDDQACGKGTMKFSDGSFYDGEWKNDAFHGEGVWSAADKKSIYDGEFLNGVPHGIGVRTTSLGSKFQGQFRHGKPYQGTWTRRSGSSIYKTPQVDSQAQIQPPQPLKAKIKTAKAKFILLIALDMYIHVMVGFFLAYWIGFIDIWNFHLDLFALVPIIETICFLEDLYPRIRAMLPGKFDEGGARTASVFMKPLNFDSMLIASLQNQSQNDVIQIDFEWFNYTLAQFWHTYEEWAGDYIRSLIETNIGSMKWLTLEECTLGKSPITTTTLHSKARNTDPRLRRERDLDAERSSEDQIVDLYADLKWCSDFFIKFKVCGLLPISIEDLYLHAPVRVVFEWLALDNKDPEVYPNLSYLALEPTDRFELSLSLKLFGFLDLFSIPPFANLLQQDYILDILFDALGGNEGSGKWMDFVRGRKDNPCVLVNSKNYQEQAAKMKRKEAGDVVSILKSVAESRLQVSIKVLSANGSPFQNPRCVLRVGPKYQVEQLKAPDIEKMTKNAESGKFVTWEPETFSWFATASTNETQADWLSITVMDCTMFGSKPVGIYKKPLSEIFFANQVVANGPPKIINCDLAEANQPRKKVKGQNDADLPSVRIELHLYSLGVSNPTTLSLQGKMLKEVAEEQRKPAVIRVVVNDCQNLHPKMNAKLPAANKLKPHVRIFYGPREIFQKYKEVATKRKEQGNTKKLPEADKANVEEPKGFADFLKSEKSNKSRVKEFRTKAIEPGHMVTWSESEGKVLFDENIPAADAFVLAEVYHEDIIMGHTVVQTEDLELDCELNGFRLNKNRMLRPLCGPDRKLVRGNEERDDVDKWNEKSCERYAQMEIPIITLHILLKPKVLVRPSIQVTVLRTSPLPKAWLLSSRPDPFVVVALCNDTDANYKLQRHETKFVSNTFQPIWAENNAFTLERSENVDQWQGEVLRFILMDKNMLTTSKELGSCQCGLDKFVKDNNLVENDSQEISLQMKGAGKTTFSLYCHFQILGDWPSK